MILGSGGAAEIRTGSRGVRMTIAQLTPAGPVAVRPSPVTFRALWRLFLGVTWRGAAADRGSVPSRHYRCLPSRNNEIAFSMRRCLVAVVFAALMVSTW